MNQPDQNTAVNGTTPAGDAPKPDTIINVPGAKPHMEPIPAKGPFVVPPVAADGVIIQLQSLPSVDELKGKWKRQMGAAKIAWGELTEDELLKSEGQQQKLAGLVQERYAVTRDEADKQIKAFFAKHTS